MMRVAEKGAIENGAKETYSKWFWREKVPKMADEYTRREAWFLRRQKVA